VGSTILLLIGDIINERVSIPADALGRLILLRIMVCKTRNDQSWDLVYDNAGIARDRLRKSAHRLSVSVDGCGSY
jgi:hypothetical protein